MQKKVNPKLFSLFLLSTIMLIGGCASTKPIQVADYRDMSCEEIQAEIDTLNTKVAQEQTNKEMGRAAETGASVAVQGASLAGVPYIGGIFSIGRTLMNHTKQTSVNEADLNQENLFNLEGIAYEKGCFQDHS